MRERTGPRQALLLVSLLALPVLAGGCLEPFRVRVDPDTVARSSLDWNVTVGDLHRKGWLGPRSVETRYTHDPDGRAPPFPGVLQVFSVREVDRTATGALLKITEDLVEEAVAEHGIELSDEVSEGSRTLDGGVRTRWFMREGRTEATGTLFPRSSTVRLLGEVGYDGKSSTSFVVVALAQVAEFDPTPIVGGERRDLRTWIEIAGDPRGSVDGAVGQNGFVYHLDTHG